MFYHLSTGQFSRCIEEQNGLEGMLYYYQNEKRESRLSSFQTHTKNKLKSFIHLHLYLSE